MELARWSQLVGGGVREHLILYRDEQLLSASDVLAYPNYFGVGVSSGGSEAMRRRCFCSSSPL